MVRINKYDDAISAGQNIIIIDDLLATGGTIEACTKLGEKLGGNVISSLFVIELKGLGNRKVTPMLRSLIKYPAYFSQLDIKFRFFQRALVANRGSHGRQGSPATTKATQEASKNTS